MKEKEMEIDRERERQRETYRQTDRQKCRKRSGRVETRERVPETDHKHRGIQDVIDR